MISISGDQDRHLPRIGLSFVLAGLCVVISGLSLLSGKGGAGSFGAFLDIFETQPEIARTILMDVRLPRTLLGLLVGATLGLAGAALQGLLRNPLASPSVIGVSSGAAFGAVATFYFGLFGSSVLALPTGGIIGAVGALTFLYLLAGRRADVTTIILAGVAVNALASALTSLALNMAPSPFTVFEIVFWLLGSLADRSMDHVVVALPFMVAGWVLMLSSGRGLNALTLGEEAAASLGHHQGWLTARIILGAGLAVGAAVSVTGAVGFVGLVVPHMVRPLVGYRPDRLLVPSALAGAVILVAADTAIRLASPGQELKLGVVTALIGGPFFLYLILSQRWRRQRMMS